jgi:polyhydroxyalkanoate synthesis regulator phasin
MLERKIDMVSRTVYTEVAVDVDLTYFETDDLIDELENRGHMADTDSKALVESIYQKRRNGKDFSHELDQLIYTALGKIA